MADGKSLAAYLKDRRTRLDPAAFGFPKGRRRTPGLRREEVAQRANISATWYTWLEQGRGGAPSAAVLERIAKGLLLTDTEREHLFMLGLGRLPDIRYKPFEGVTPRLQRVLDGMPLSPAIVKTATWDIVAWNKAAAAMLTDYSKLRPEQRNVLRLMFTSPGIRSKQDDWESVARFVVGTFRADVARAGAHQSDEVFQLVEELCRTSEEFATLWAANDVIAQGDGVKRLRRPDGGVVEMEFSTFKIEGRPDLSMIIYNPVSIEDAKLVQSRVDAHRD
ncbi:helix-turn-helix transcriptional regulator [Sphingomonas sp.]|uniref:helix-turn-helix transcriptional regulator n=1 Tax=Sphingomonas sp. TaxID=28214 RepID=UPI003B3AC5A1